jgi:uncharacterized protein (DUF305 family)
MSHGSHHAGSRESAHATNHYPRLYVMVVFSFVAMYALMFAMVDEPNNLFNSLNQVYMAGLMTAAMVIIELVVMRAMYHDRTRNSILFAVSALALAGCWFLIRQLGGFGDRHFLRSMSPHHAGAVLMCREAPIDDAEIRRLCLNIISSQQREIEFMKAKLGASR